MMISYTCNIFFYINFCFILVVFLLPTGPQFFRDLEQTTPPLYFYKKKIKNSIKLIIWDILYIIGVGIRLNGLA